MRNLRLIIQVFIIFFNGILKKKMPVKAITCVYKEGENILKIITPIGSTDDKKKILNHFHLPEEFDIFLNNEVGIVKCADVYTLLISNENIIFLAQNEKLADELFRMATKKRKRENEEDGPEPDSKRIRTK